MKMGVGISILSAFLFCCFGGLAKAAINSNSKILDGIEYYVQTDKSTYELGEEVEMLYKITNLSGQNVTIALPNSAGWNFWVAKDDQLVYQAIKAWYDVYIEFTLRPDHYIEFPIPNPPCIWNLHNNAGELVGTGNYDVIGGLGGPYHSSQTYEPTRVSVSIEIIPEPATFVLFAVGLPVFRIFTRKKK